MEFKTWVMTAGLATVLAVFLGSRYGEPATSFGLPQGAPIPPPPDLRAPPADAKRTGSGLVSRLLVPGRGSIHPGPRDLVTVHYTQWTTDGKMIDSSRLRGVPSQFHLHWSIAGWAEGIQLMVAGEQRRLWIPEELAYRGKPGRPKGTLVIDVELLDFIKTPSPPPDIAAPPPDAKWTASGLAWKTLTPGTGSGHPGTQSVVTMHFSIWTAEGRLLRSSVSRGRPLTFRLDEVIPGWTEGAQLMVEGEKRRFWVPEALGSKTRRGLPVGPLVLELELISIDK